MESASTMTFNSLSFCDSRRRTYFEFTDQEEARRFAGLLNGEVSQNNKGTWSVVLSWIGGDRDNRDDRIVRYNWSIFCPLFSRYADVSDRSNYFLVMSPSL